MLDVYYRLSTVSSDSSSFCPANVHSVQSCEQNLSPLPRPPSLSVPVADNRQA